MLAVTLKTSGNDVDENTSATTASIAVTAGVPIVVDVICDSVTSGQDQSPTSITGPGGLSFTKVGEKKRDVDYIWESKWVGIPSSSASGTITITFSNNMDCVVWSVSEVTGASPLTSNGSAMFAQHVTGNVASGSGTTDSETLAALAAAHHMTIAAYGVENQSATIRTATAKSGWVELSDNGGNMGSYSNSLEVQYKVPGETASSVTWSAGTGIKSAIVSEIKGNLGPTITTQPTEQTAADGATATFTTAATYNNGALSYQWQSQSPNGGSWSNIVSGGTSASYVTPALSRASDNGACYRCQVTDSDATITTNAAAARVTSVPTAYTGTGLVVGATTSYVGYGAVGQAD